MAKDFSRKPNVRLMGGMVERRWSGKRMWECRKCGATTFNPSEARTHTCRGREARPADVPLIEK